MHVMLGLAARETLNDTPITYFIEKHPPENPDGCFCFIGWVKRRLSGFFFHILRAFAIAHGIRLFQYITATPYRFDIVFAASSLLQFFA